MGFWSSLFGGPEVMDTTSPEIRGIADQLRNFDPGLGMAGKLAKGYLKDVKHGRMDNLPGVQLAKSQGATDWRELQRGIQMSTAGLPGEQSALTAGLLSGAQLGNQDQVGQHSIQAAANDINNFSNIYSLARGQRTQAQEQGLMGAGDLLSRGRQVVQKQGILGKLGQLTSLAGNFLPFLGMAGGGGSNNPTGGGIGGPLASIWH